MSSNSLTNKPDVRNSSDGNLALEDLDLGVAPEPTLLKTIETPAELSISSFVYQEVEARREQAKALEPTPAEVRERKLGFPDLETQKAPLNPAKETKIVTADPALSKYYASKSRRSYGNSPLDKLITWLADLIKRLEVKFLRSLEKKPLKQVIVAPDKDSPTTPVAKKKKRRGWFAFIR